MNIIRLILHKIYLHRLYNKMKKEYTWLNFMPYPHFSIFSTPKYIHGDGGYNPMSGQIYIYIPELLSDRRPTTLFLFGGILKCDINNEREILTKVLLHEIRHSYQHYFNKFDFGSPKLIKIVLMVVGTKKYFQLAWERDANKFAVKEYDKWKGQL